MSDVLNAFSGLSQVSTAAGPAYKHCVSTPVLHSCRASNMCRPHRTCREGSANCLLHSYSHLLPCSMLVAFAKRVTAASGKLGGVCPCCCCCCCWMSASKSSVLASRTCFRCGMATKACCRSCCRTGPSYKGISTGQTHHDCPHSGRKGEESLVELALGTNTETRFHRESKTDNHF